jgi:hypothetical protein
MLIILNGIVVSLFLFSLLLFSLFKLLTRYSVLKQSSMDVINSLVTSKVSKCLAIALFYVFFMVNLSGNVPLNSIPTLFYSQTLTISFLF